jgi:6-phosphogluconolactonase
MTDTAPHKEILPNAEALAQRVAEWVYGLAKASEGVFRICLSGGSTPKRLYELLATRYREDFPWDRVHWYFGDERYVPRDHEKSNYLMAEKALFSQAPIPVSHIHGVITDSENAGIAAYRYQALLQRTYGGAVLMAGKSFFDIMLLGLGEDGHTASLFPGVKALKEAQAWVVEVPDGTPPPTRISLTFPVLNSSRHCAFLAAGDGKKEPLARIMRGDQTAPSAHIKPVGDLYFFIDQAAKPDNF